MRPEPHVSCTLSGVKPRIYKTQVSSPKSQIPSPKSQELRPLYIPAWNLDLGIWVLEFFFRYVIENSLHDITCRKNNNPCCYKNQLQIGNKTLMF